MSSLEEDLSSSLPELTAKIDEIESRVMVDGELEMDKLAREGAKMAAAVDFLTWLNENGIYLAVPVLGQLSRVEASPDQVAASYCNIDLERLNEERAEFLAGYAAEDDAQR